MTPDERHADIVRRYPNGLTAQQFRFEALASADENGQIDPPALADWFAKQGLLMGMLFDGLIEQRSRYEAGPWFITAKGRAEVNGITPPAATTTSASEVGNG